MSNIEELEEVSITDLMTIARGRCDAENRKSLIALKHDFNESFRAYSRPIKDSNPWFIFFCDWLLKQAGKIECRDGIWERWNFDSWWVVSEISAGDHDVYSAFCRYFDQFCLLEQQLVSATHKIIGDATKDESITRFELYRLGPEQEVYLLACYGRRVKPIREWRKFIGCYSSTEVAKQVAESAFRVSAADWKE